MDEINLTRDEFIDIASDVAADMAIGIPNETKKQLLLLLLAAYCTELEMKLFGEAKERIEVET